MAKIAKATGEIAFMGVGMLERRLVMSLSLSLPFLITVYCRSLSLSLSRLRLPHLARIRIHLVGFKRHVVTKQYNSRSVMGSRIWVVRKV